MSDDEVTRSLAQHRHDLSSREANVLADMLAASERRIDRVQNELPGQIEEAMLKLKDGLLTEDEKTWVKLAIKREGQSIALRQAIIEKSLTGLVWMAIVGIGLIVKEWASNHGYKP